MAPKRKNDGPPAADEQTARERKKQKVTAARTIAVQPPAGPSTSIREHSMQGLPAMLDIEKFTEARSFEIRAMQDAISNAKGGSSHRTWQQLPRHLRRRAASHDVRRVPVRLRDKARAEMDPVKKKLSSRSGPKRGVTKSLSRTEKFIKRQKDKIWLESHIWHAKRMKMENMWGYRLAVQPTEKSFRPSHRASVHGAILHDASYYSLIELQGAQKILKRLLDFCCEPYANPGATRYLTGARVCHTHIYGAESFPFDLISVVTVLWQPVKPAGLPNSLTDVALTGSDDHTSAERKKRRRPMNKGKIFPNHMVEDAECPRTIWILSHPSVHDAVFKALQLSASFALEAFKKKAPEKEEYKVEMLDRRQKVNVFEIMGPKSSQVLRGALTPVVDERKEFREFWSALKDLRSPGELPSGMVVGFKVQDPRLNFPPKNATVSVPEGLPSIPRSLHCFPTSALARSEIWDHDILKSLTHPRFKKKDLDERRSKNDVPGTDLPPKRQDEKLPCLLIQRSLKDGTHSLHGWTVIVPSGWSMPFFSSFIYTGTRVGGQRERQTQSFEAGVPYFPRDYPTTEQYTRYSDEREREEKGEWERKPPAKRVNYVKTGTRNPWRPDWKVVLGVQSVESSEFVPSQRETGPVVRPWLLRGGVLSSVLNKVSDMLNPAAGLLSEINHLRVSMHNEPLGASVRAEHLWKGALVVVQLVPCGRGSPEDLAMIYQLDNDEIEKRRQTERMRKTGTLNLDEEDPELTGASTVSPDNIIGYVTTGNYSLSTGKGHAIGAMPLAKFLEIRKQAARLHETTPLVKIRNRDGLVYRTAYVHLSEN